MLESICSGVSFSCWQNKRLLSCTDCSWSIFLNRHQTPAARQSSGATDLLRGTSEATQLIKGLIFSLKPNNDFSKGCKHYLTPLHGEFNHLSRCGSNCVCVCVKLQKKCSTLPSFFFGWSSVFAFDRTNTCSWGYIMVLRHWLDRRLKIKSTQMCISLHYLHRRRGGVGRILCTLILLCEKQDIVSWCGGNVNQNPERVSKIQT